MVVLICVGSSCHIKGAPEIVSLLTKSIEEHHLEDEITLAGSFCIGKCNRLGVTIQVDDEVYPGISPTNFKEFFKEKILDVLKKE
jgi:NADH:ubiquinone oxidoreductase subunit E